MTTTEVTTAEQGLARATQLTAAIAQARDDEVVLLRERDELWVQLNRDLHVTKKAIAEACSVTPDAVYQGLRRAEGNPRRETARAIDG